MTSEPCTWCGTDVGPHDGYRLAQSPGDPPSRGAGRRAVFCRLEHVVPWAIQGPSWEPGAPTEPADVADSLDACARCGEPLGDVRLVLVRHRGEHRIPDGFCSVEHLREWAAGGGRYG